MPMTVGRRIVFRIVLRRAMFRIAMVMMVSCIVMVNQDCARGIGMAQTRDIEHNHLRSILKPIKNKGLLVWVLVPAVFLSRQGVFAGEEVR